MRNALIARSSVCLVAVGGGMGTLSEMAFGLKVGKTVFSLHAEYDLPGLTKAENADDLVEQLVTWLHVKTCI